MGLKTLTNYARLMRSRKTPKDQRRQRLYKAAVNEALKARAIPTDWNKLFQRISATDPKKRRKAVYEIAMQMSSERIDLDSQIDIEIKV